MKTTLLGLSLSVACTNAFLTPSQPLKPAFLQMAQEDTVVMVKDVSEVADEPMVVQEASLKMAPEAVDEPEVVLQQASLPAELPAKVQEASLQMTTETVAEPEVVLQQVSLPAELPAKVEAVVNNKPPLAVVEKADTNEVSEALTAIGNIQSQIAQAKVDLSAGTLERKSYIVKLHEYTAQLDQITQKMETAKAASYSKLDQLNQAIATLEEGSRATDSKIEQLTLAIAQLEGGAQKTLAKLGDVSLEVASSGITDMF